MQPLPEQRLEPEQDVREFIFDTLVGIRDVFGIDSFFNEDEHGFIVSFRPSRKSLVSRCISIRQALKGYALDRAVSVEAYGEHTVKVVLK